MAHETASFKLEVQRQFMSTTFLSDRAMRSPWPEWLQSYRVVRSTWSYRRPLTNVRADTRRRLR